jgi:hypothetical protein
LCACPFDRLEECPKVSHSTNVGEQRATGIAAATAATTATAATIAIAAEMIAAVRVVEIKTAHRRRKANTKKKNA